MSPHNSGGTFTQLFNMIITTMRQRDIERERGETMKCRKGGKNNLNKAKVNTLKVKSVLCLFFRICYCFLFSVAQVKVLTRKQEAEGNSKRQLPKTKLEAQREKERRRRRGREKQNQ